MLAYCEETICRDVTDSDQRRFLSPSKTERNIPSSVHTAYFY